MEKREDLKGVPDLRQQRGLLPELKLLETFIVWKAVEGARHAVVLLDDGFSAHYFMAILESQQRQWHPPDAQTQKDVLAIQVIQTGFLSSYELDHIIWPAVYVSGCLRKI